MTKIKRITVTNLKAISAMDATFNGCTAIITGSNNEGKSTFLRALIDRLRSIKPDVVVKDGEEKGSYEMVLTSGEKFVWTFSGVGPKFKEKILYFSERNIPGSVTKDVMKHYFPATFDIDRFLQEGPKWQQDALKKISGIEFGDWQKSYDEAVETRRFQNKLVVTEQARLLTYDPKMATELLPVDELQTELNGIEAHNMRHKSVVDGKAQRVLQHNSNQTEIEELQAKIRQLQEKNEAINEAIVKADEWLSVPKNYPKTNAAELQKKIADIAVKNKEISENITAKKQQDIYDIAVKNAAASDVEVKQLEADKVEMLKNSDLPEGFGFSDDGITYNGFAFTKEQLSSSGLTIAALKLASIGLGEVKSLHFDASLLDKASLLEVEKWATEQGLQLLIEKPSYENQEIQYEIISSAE